MKALKKEDIIVQFNALQAKFDIIEKKNIDLEQEKKSHIEAINLLEETIKILEDQANLRHTDKKTKDVQTDTSKLEGEKSEVYLCGEGDYTVLGLIQRQICIYFSYEIHYSHWYIQTNYLGPYSNL